MIIKEVKVLPEKPKPITLKTESPCGLMYAVVYEENQVIALFNSYYWAKAFVEDATNIQSSLQILTVSDEE